MGALIVIAVVGAFTYYVGLSDGRFQAFEGASISYCETGGDYCHVETKYAGEVSVSCNEYKKCVLIDKTSEEIERQETLKKDVEEVLQSL